MTVVLAHASGVHFKPWGLVMRLHESPAAIFMNGTGAVHVFFVLSGYCLVASAERGGQLLDLLQFYVRRFSRVHVPYVFGLLAAWLASFACHDAGPVPGLTPWLVSLRSVHLDSQQLLVSVLWPGPAGGQIAIGWTLRVEMIYSLLLPFMVVVARRSTGRSCWWSRCGLCWCSRASTARSALRSTSPPASSCTSNASGSPGRSPRCRRRRSGSCSPVGSRS
jgi:peptidoglycan/LPS O-acetylase OafA/YrhL